MRFEKWEALGNTYVLVRQPEAGALTPARARRLCDVREGIGSDGVLELTPPDGQRAGVTIWNPDGSIAEMSGNGLRIAAAWLAGESGASHVWLDTAKGEIGATLHPGGVVELALGAVHVAEAETLAVAGEPGSVELTPVSVGNPHAVIRLDAASRDDLLRLGPAIESSPRFPGRTNVQLVRVRDRHGIDVLVWERGAGETSASGSSATAAAAVAIARGWCASPVTVAMRGGEVTVSIEDGSATLVGPVSRIAVGETDHD
jgi:diaminopimelate epimerase